MAITDVTVVSMDLVFILLGIFLVAFLGFKFRIPALQFFSGFGLILYSFVFFGGLWWFLIILFIGIVFIYSGYNSTTKRGYRG